MEPTGDGTPELVHTPGCAAIADVAEFFKISPASDIKCVAYMALKRGVAGKPDTWHGVAAFLRGDHQVNETKLLGAAGAAELRTMQGEELSQFFNGPAGFLGPVGLKPNAKLLEDGITVIVDKSLEGRKNLVAGANKLDYHLRNVTSGPRFHLDSQRRHSQRERRRSLPAIDRLPLRASSSSAKPLKWATSSSSATSTPSPWARACSIPTARK